MSSPESPEAADALASDESEERAERPGDAPAPKPKKKKRKKKKHAQPASAPRAPAGDGPLPARFLEKFPADPELDQLVRAFEAGDYASVRQRAPRLADETDDSRVRDAALELLRRIEPDPLMRYMLFASLGLLLFMILYFYANRS